MLSNKTPMNLQYFAEEGSQSNTGQAGGGESGNPAGQGNGTQSNGKTGDQSNSQNFMEGIIKKALAGAPSNQQQTQTQNNGKTGDQQKPNNEPSNNNLPKTQAELDALITKRVSREYQKGLDDGKKSGMTEAQRLASILIYDKGDNSTGSFTKFIPDGKIVFMIARVKETPCV